MRIKAIGQYFEALGRGDPIAWGLTIFFIAVAIFIILIALKFRANHRREDEERKNKWLKKDKKK
jgi:hypothetical protein